VFQRGIFLLLELFVLKWSVALDSATSTWGLSNYWGTV